MEKNAGEWTGSVEISKKEIPGSKRSMHGLLTWPTCTDLLQALKGERLSSVFSPDGTLISASAAPHCGEPFKETFRKRYIVERTKKAEIRLGEQSENTESFRENLWNEIQVKGP